jgi:peptidoglycan hydrolase CwlO-like protein
MQELLINAEQIFLLVIGIMAIIICLYCCKSSESSGQTSAIMKNQDIMLKSINGDFMTIGHAIDRIERDVDYLKGKVNKIDEYIDNQSKQ